MLVYHFLNEEYGLESLRKKRLKVSIADDLNDPFEHMAIELNDKELRGAMKCALSAMAKKQGLICFSNSWRSPVMWSHYANRHRGVCLGFEIPDECLSEVIYRDERLPYNPDILESDPEAAKNLMFNLATTKFSAWSYEDEWRVFVDLSETTQENRLHFATYSKELQLKKIIVGHHAKMTRQQIEDLIEKQDNRPDCFKARPAFKSFNMTPQRNESLWQ